VYDNDGEECKEMLVGGISQEPKAVVNSLQLDRHKFEVGDLVRFKELSGMTNLNDGIYEILGVRSLFQHLIFYFRCTESVDVRY
jgi:hypothetical protein